MTTEVALYDAVNKYFHDGTIDLDTDTIMVALLTAAYNPLPAVPTTWTAYAQQAKGSFLQISGIYYEATTPGIAGFVSPNFPTIRGSTVTDGSVVWTCWGRSPPSPHTVFADISATQLPTALGYTAGGAALTGKLITYAGRQGKFTADPVAWSGASFTTARYAAMYRAGVVNGVTDPLICYVLLDNTPADIVILTATAFTIAWNTAGIFTF